MSFRYAFDRIGLCRQVAGKRRLVSEAAGRHGLALATDPSRRPNLRKPAGREAAPIQIFAAVDEALRGRLPLPAPQPPMRTPLPAPCVALRLVGGTATAAREPLADSEWGEF